MSKKILEIIWGIALICILVFSLVQFNEKQETISTSSNSGLSNKKIEWGIKRGQNHEQPDVGEENKRIINQYDGICMGNPELPYVYLTFDNGYEAGYTEEILNILKENEVPATFFVTGHYINTQPELVKRMIDEGHIVGNHTPNFLMYGNDIKVKCYSNSLLKQLYSDTINDTLNDTLKFNKIKIFKVI